MGERYRKSHPNGQPLAPTRRYWWQLPDANCASGGTQGSWCYNVPIAFSCDELFVQSWLSNGTLYVRSLSRIELSALGAPSPPD